MDANDLEERWLEEDALDDIVKGQHNVAANGLAIVVYGAQARGCPLYVLVGRLKDITIEEAF